MSLIGREIYQAASLRRLLSVVDGEPGEPGARERSGGDAQVGGTVRRFPRWRRPARTDTRPDERPERRAR